jgi:hypothetical protein
MSDRESIEIAATFAPKLFVTEEKDHTIRFFRRAGEQVGKLDFNGPKMTFEGDAEASVDAFVTVFAGWFYSRVKEVATALAQPEQEPVMFNGLTEAETNESASVMGSTPPQSKPEPAGVEDMKVYAAIADGYNKRQREPLTEEVLEYLAPVGTTWRDMVKFARRVERAHGIGGEHEQK